MPQFVALGHGQPSVAATSARQPAPPNSGLRRRLELPRQILRRPTRTQPARSSAAEAPAGTAGLDFGWVHETGSTSSGTFPEATRSLAAALGHLDSLVRSPLVLRSLGQDKMAPTRGTSSGQVGHAGFQGAKIPQDRKDHLTPLAQWICDTCDGMILSPGEGWLEWLEPTDLQDHSFRIVHHWTSSPRKDSGGCYQHQGDPDCRDAHLHELLGPQGLVYLLSFLDPGPHHEPDYERPRIGDMRNFIEVFRRLHIPHYEEARLYWDRAYRAGWFDGANEVYMYQPRMLERIALELGEIAD